MSRIYIVVKLSPEPLDDQSVYIGLSSPPSKYWASTHCKNHMKATSVLSKVQCWSETWWYLGVWRRVLGQQTEHTTCQSGKIELYVFWDTNCSWQGIKHNLDWLNYFWNHLVVYFKKHYRTVVNSHFPYFLTWKWPHFGKLSVRMHMLCCRSLFHSQVSCVLLLVSLRFVYWQCITTTTLTPGRRRFP